MSDQPTGSLSVLQGTALSIGAVLGTGVLTLPSMATQLAGPASLIAWLFLILLSIPLASTFAALGARYPDAGGVSTFVRTAFGPRLATAVGWLLYFSVPIGTPPAAGFAGAYVADLLGGGRATQLATAAVLLVGVATLNWFGIRVSGRAQLGIAGSLTLLLTIAIVVALPHLSMARLTPFAPHGWLAVGSAAGLLVWAFAGWEALSSLSAEYREPSRDIPRATGFALVVVAVLYLGISFVTVAAFGSQAGPAPLSDLLQFGFGHGARAVTTLVAVLLTAGTMNAYLSSMSRLGAALARDGALPAWLGHTSGPQAVPRRSLSLIAGLAALVLVWSTLSGLAVEVTMTMVTAAFTLVYVVGTAAAVKLIPRGRRTWWAAVVSLVASLALLAMTGWSVLVAVGMVGVSLIWSALRQRAGSRQTRTTSP